ncbi:hypothetical protein ACP4OV_029278 [Aristida adscensionis]
MATTGSDLPPEMVCCIAERADVGCRARMRAVCSLWRALVPAGLPQPWVLLQPAAATATATVAATAGGDRESDRFRVLSLPANQELTLSPAFTSGCGVPGARCVGAAHGWLALVGADLSITLHNLFTGRSVSLPPLANHPMLKGGVRDDGTVLIRPEVNDDTNLETVTAEYVRDNLVRKIVFSPAPEQDDYFVVQLLAHDESERIPPYAMYARAGATRWKTLRDIKDEEPFKGVRDVLHVEGSRFLAVRLGLGDVYQLDLAAEDSVNDEEDEDAFVYNADNQEEDDSDVYPPSFSSVAPEMNYPTGSGQGVGITDNNLVLVDGELYQVWAKWAVDPAPAEEYVRYSVIREAGVVKLDLVEQRWMKVVAGELDDLAVLVGANETAAVRAGDMPGLRGNCVYFIDGYLEKVACAIDLKTQRVEAVDCEMLQRAWPKGPWRGRSPQPMWFSPSYADAVGRGGCARPSRLSPPKGRHRERADHPSGSCPPGTQGRHHERADDHPSGSGPPGPQGSQHEPAQCSGVVSSEPTARVLKTRRSSGYTIPKQTTTLMIN